MDCLKSRTESILSHERLSWGTVESILASESLQLWQHGVGSWTTAHDSYPHPAMLWISVSLQSVCSVSLWSHSDSILLSVLGRKCSFWSSTPGIAILWTMTRSGSISLPGREGWRLRCLVPSSTTQQLLQGPPVSPSLDSGTMKVGKRVGAQAVCLLPQWTASQTCKYAEARAFRDLLTNPWWIFVNKVFSKVWSYRKQHFFDLMGCDVKSH